MRRKIFESYKHSGNDVAVLPNYRVKITARSYVDYIKESAAFYDSSHLH